MSGASPEVLELMWRHLRRSGLAPWVTPGELSPELSWPLTAHEGNTRLRAQLLDQGWIDDPAPGLRARTKPFVRWSLRERRPGPALHVEDQDTGLFVHLDVLSPGTHRWLFPLHLAVDYAGWGSVRVRLIHLLAAGQRRRAR